MTPLCCVIIPTRKRVATLRLAIESFLRVTDVKSFEIRLKIDDNDESTLASLQSILSMSNNIIPHISPQGRGYPMISRWFGFIAKKSSAPWIWAFNDDAVLEVNHGVDWIGLLSRVPTAGFLVQPEIHRLGTSTYPRVEAGPFPIFPNGCWGKQIIKDPLDIQLHELLMSKGWKTHWLEGVGFWHNRPSEEEIAIARA